METRSDRLHDHKPWVDPASHDMGNTEHSPPPSGFAPAGDDPRSEARLSRVVASLLESLDEDCDTFETLTRLARGLVEVLPAAEAGLLFVDDQGRLGVVASTSESSDLMELYQLQTREGPCLDAGRTGRRIVIGGLAEAEERWPAFAALAAAHGFLSTLAIPLLLQGEVVGCANIFGRTTELATPEAVDTAQALVDAAGATLRAHQRIERMTSVTEQLNRALESRVAIEQAKGIIAEHAGIEVEAAFELLRAYARRHRLKVAAVAARVAHRTIAAGELLGQL